MRLTDQGYRLLALELQKKTKPQANYLRHPNTFLSHFQRTQIPPISSVTCQFHLKQAPQAQVVGNPQILANRKGHLLQSLQVQNQVRDCSIYQETQPPNSLIQGLRAHHLLEFSVCQLVHLLATPLQRPHLNPLMEEMQTRSHPIVGCSAQGQVQQTQKIPLESVPVCWP